MHYFDIIIDNVVALEKKKESAKIICNRGIDVISTLHSVIIYNAANHGNNIRKIQ